MKLYLLIFLLFVLYVSPEAFSEDVRASFLLEKISLGTHPVKSCIYKFLNNKNVVERCDSIVLSLDKSGVSSGTDPYLVMHHFLQEELNNVSLIWTMYVLEDGMLVSTKLHKPRAERLVEGGMQLALEGEVQSMVKSLEEEELKLKSLNEEIETIIADPSKRSALNSSIKAYGEFQDKRDKNLLETRFSSVESHRVSAEGSDNRGDLTEQLKAVLSGKLR